MHDSNKDFSVAVIIIGAEGVPIVKERYREDNRRHRLWKFPGGHGVVGETPEEAAIREVHEETNIEIYKDEIKFLLVEDRQNPVPHRFYLFYVNISNVRLPDRCKRFLLGEGVTGEKTKIIKLCDIMESIELESHKRLLKIPKVQNRIQKILQDQNHNKARRL